MSLQARSFSTGRILQESLARYPTLRVAMALRFAQIQVPMASEIAFIDELGLRNKEDISAELENLRRVVSPKVRRLSFNSPLVIELIGSAASGGLYLLKNPDRIGSWLPRIRKSWYTGQAEAERAHRIYTILKRAGIRAEELEDRKAIN